MSWVKRLSSKASSKWKLLRKLFYKCSTIITYFDDNHTSLSEEPIRKFYPEIHTLSMKFYKENPQSKAKIFDQSL